MSFPHRLDIDFDIVTAGAVYLEAVLRGGDEAAATAAELWPRPAVLAQALALAAVAEQLQVHRHLPQRLRDAHAVRGHQVSRLELHLEARVRHVHISHIAVLHLEAGRDNGKSNINR